MAPQRDSFKSPKTRPASKRKAKIKARSSIQVPFHGKSIVCVEATLDEMTEYWVALKPTCDMLGLSYVAQYERLMRDPKATIRVSRTVGTGGKIREMVLANSQTFKRWLASIDLSRITADPELLAWLNRFQDEVGAFLDSHFRGERLVFTPPSGDPDGLKQENLRLKVEIEDANRRLTQAGNELVAARSFCELAQAKLMVTDGMYAKLAVECYDLRNAKEAIEQAWHEFTRAVQKREEERRSAEKTGQVPDPGAAHQYLTVREYLNTAEARRLPGLEAYRQGELRISAASAQVANRCRKRGRQIRHVRDGSSTLATYPMDILHAWGVERNDILRHSHEQWLRATEGMGEADSDE